MKYKRIMLKISGEALAGDRNFGIEHKTLQKIAKRIAEVAKKDIEIAVVIGGGNIWRWRDTQESGIERTSSDAMGMLATVMNAVALQSALESLGCYTRVLSAVDIPQLAEPYIRRRAVRHLEKAASSSARAAPATLLTTDSAAALRALELGYISKARTSRRVRQGSTQVQERQALL